MTPLPDQPLKRTRFASADLRAAWEEGASAFVAWARKPGHDSYWLFHRDLFRELLPPPGQRTLDLGCGEGRLSRELKALGHDVAGVDASPTMLAAARAARILEPGGRHCVAIVHPLNSAGSFESAPDSPFVDR